MGTFLKVIGGCVVAVGVAVALPYMISDLIDQKIQKMNRKRFHPLQQKRKGVSTPSLSFLIIHTTSIKFYFIRFNETQVFI